MANAPGPVTALLARVNAGEQGAFDRLFPLVYAQLRGAADRLLRSERPEHTLQPTALVHEAYLKLVGSSPLPSQDRAQFFAIAARAMRQILVDHARRRSSGKRGGGAPMEALSGLEAAPNAMQADELVALDDALARLSRVSPRLRTVVELRFFAGLDENEIASQLNVTTRTVQRDWAKARAWLYREVYGDAMAETPGARQKDGRDGNA
jgi:RNA polymerase sigma factor (TIGR02999 family)